MASSLLRPVGLVVRNTKHTTAEGVFENRIDYFLDNLRGSRYGVPQPVGRLSAGYFKEVVVYCSFLVLIGTAVSEFEELPVLNMV